jgi:hypothetical protein
MKCPKCNHEFEPDDVSIEIGANVDDAVELTTKCPNKKCGTDLYTFVEIDWAVNE